MQRLQYLSRQLSSQKTAASNSLIIIEKQYKTAIVHLNQPKTLNTLANALVLKLNEELKKLDNDPQVKVIILMGTGRCFCAGANLKELSKVSLSDTVLTDPISTWFHVIPNLHKPIIAAVHGMALGGGFQIAMMCDIIIADGNAKFGFPQIKVGLFPGAGGTQKLIKEIGKSRAMSMILTGDFISARQLSKMGVISQVVESKDKHYNEAQGVKLAALNLAKKITKNSGIVMAVAKKMILKSQDLPLEQGIDYERMNFHKVFGLADANEGMKAFLEKRKAKWQEK